MRIAVAIAVCVCAMTLFGRDNHPHQSASSPGVVNVDPLLQRDISKATSRAEELVFVFHQTLRRASSDQELRDADEFYDREVVPAQIERLKKESLLHSFEYEGVPTPSRIHHITGNCNPGC